MALIGEDRQRKDLVVSVSIASGTFQVSYSPTDEYLVIQLGRQEKLTLVSQTTLSVAPESAMDQKAGSRN
jgi:hypothetical protein